MKRIGIIFIFMMLVTSCITVVFPIETVKASGNTLYVGGSGPGNYTAIQSAIDAANPGDTVFIYDDSSPYYENIVIDITVNLTGENNSSTYLSSILISYTFNCNISNLKINLIDIIESFNNKINNCIITGLIKMSEGSCQNIVNNNFLMNSNGIEIWDASNNNIIENNSIINATNRGIIVGYSSGNIISNNSIENTKGDGIRLFTSLITVIKDNRMVNDGIGIFGGSQVSYFTHEIINNTANGKPIYYFKNQEHISLSGDIGQAIFVNCENITVDNTSLNLTNHGIELIYCNNGLIKNSSFSNPTHGIYIMNSNDILVNQCQFSRGFNSLDSGEIISIGESNNITIKDNVFDKVKNGVRCWCVSDKNTIINNIFNNTGSSVTLYQAENQIIEKNNIYQNKLGISIEHNCYFNLVKENNFFKNNLGIAISFIANNNIIYHNNFINNLQNVYDLFSNIWNNSYPSGGNYFDDYTGFDNYHGPNQDVLGSDGIGDTPYNVPGGSNQDNYPLMYPWGEVPILIDIDIKPGDYPNTINPKSKGKVPVAILTTEDFNAVDEVDPDSIDLLSASPAKWTFDDVDDDGDIDMILHFKTQELNFSLLVDEGEDYPFACLYGETFSGESIQGKDTIRLIGQTSYSVIDWILEHFLIIGKLIQRFPFFEKILNQII